VRKNRIKSQFLRNGIRFLPFLFTLGNAFFGFCSIVLAFEGELIDSAYCIFLGAMMDALDGRIARFMKVESALGLELDSLCDAISFCLAPAFLAYVWHLRWLGASGIVIGAFFLLAGLFRLARFNLLHDEQGTFFLAFRLR
jgi:Phosphatidylserine synthase